jgi:hypothetical protein
MKTPASHCLKPVAIALALWATAQPTLALAQDAATATLSMPFGECALGQWTSNRNLDDRANITTAGCVVSWKPKLNNDFRLGLNLRASWQDQGAADGTSGRVREAYVDFDAEPFSVRAGRQIIAWGRADRINPTDSFSPRDFTLLVPDDEQQRNGIDALRLRYAINPALSLTAIVAKSQANVTPQGSLPPNLVLAEPPRETEWALKLDHSGSGVDWSVSYFDGLSRAVRYRVDFTNPRAPLFRGDVERVQKLGADFAVAQGAWTLRGEIAHARLRPDTGPTCTACPSGARRVTSAVLGGDVDFAETMNFNVQVFANLKEDFADASGLTGVREALALGLNRLNTDYATREAGVTLRLSDRLLNDKLRWEISAVLDLTGNSYAIRPRLSYAVNDHIRLTAGLDRFEGPTQSYFGALAKNSTVFAIVSWVF